MDSYVIRIYRRDPENPGNFAGHIEIVEREETKSFSGAEELMEILADSENREQIRKPIQRESGKQRKKPEKG